MKNSDASASTAALWTTVPLLMLVVACGHFNRIAIAVAGGERIISERGIAADQMGLVYSAFLAFYTLAMLPGGWFIDRYGARAALMLWGFGSALLVAMTGITGLLADDATMLWLTLLAVRSLLGVVNAPLHPAAAHMVFQRVPRRARALANGLVTSAACLGVAATYTVAGTLMDWLGWPRAFIAAGGMTLVVALVWTMATRRPPSAGGPASAEPCRAVDFPALAAVLRRPGVICITLSYAAQGYFQYQFFYWVEYFFETIERQDRSVARGYTTLITLVMGVGMVGGGWLTDRATRSITSGFRRSVVPMVAMIGSGAVFELGLLASDPRMTLAAFTVAGGLLGACEGAFWTTGVEIGGRFGGTTGALMNAGGNVGGTLSPYVTPLLAGIFAEFYGEGAAWRLGLAVAGGVAIAGAALWLGVRGEGIYEKS